MIVESSNRRRRSLRLQGYDYAQPGAYFVTICTQHRRCLFGKVTDETMRLNAAGELAAAMWNALPNRFAQIDLDAFVVMPNHIHGILIISDDVVGAPLVGARDARAATRAAPTVGARDARAATRAAPTVGVVVGAFKSAFAVEYIRGAKKGRWTAFDRRVWQRNYYEHVIRNEPDLTRVRRYIVENPLQWAFDRENPRRIADGNRVGRARDEAIA